MSLKGEFTLAIEALHRLKPSRWLNKGFLLQKKRLWLLGCLIVLGLGAGYWWVNGRQSQITYITLPVSRGNIVNAVNAPGMVEAVKSIGLDFKSSGVIKEIYVQPGDRVEAGQLLATIDITDLEAQLTQARANLESALAKLQTLQAGPEETDLIQAEANVTLAEITYNSAQEALERNQTLYDAGALSQVELNKAIADRDTAAAKLSQARATLETLRKGSSPEDIATAQAQVDVARAQLAVAQSNFDGAQLRAPWDGIVSDVRGEVGQRAGSSSGSEGFITLISTDLQLRAQVNEVDIGNVKVGQTVNFTVNAFPERSFEGQVAMVIPQATTVANVQLYDVLISLSNSNLPLLAGMTANVNIISAKKDDVITVPRAAVTFASSNQLPAGRSPSSGAPGQGGGFAERGTSGAEKAGTGVPRSGGEGGQGRPEQGETQATVMVLEQGRPVPREITIGLSDERNVEVKSGLKVGEQVIIGTSNAGKQPAASNSINNRMLPQPGGGILRIGR